MGLDIRERLSEVGLAHLFHASPFVVAFLAEEASLQHLGYRRHAFTLSPNSST